ncbi:putative phosphoglycerate mutase [Sediminihabitans luteus]|uniref:Putative phosphoglycerate mutase n=1 Tax=Sediminihabitans luteus TaxID=1138585 RepID=A0A2M9CPP9_9CELL|nr:histidine phosphatase family protein [Sediminihabitans luteus]PJJ73838.1 putative phosphoglycerate mutase [Sediminihabitans luteus]GII98252.1 phosphoglycerate mutase [Sediminihabitans luteus]
MSAGTIVLLRHGRTAYNAAMRLQGQVDIALDDVGQWQAEQGGRALASAHRATRVVASDLSRAAATAEAYAAALGGREVILDARVRERSFGEWEGLTGPEIKAGWPDEHAAWRAGGEPTSTGAELKIDVAARMVAAITEHAADLADDETLVVVSHGAAITLAVTGLLGLDAGTWRGVAGLHNVHWSHLHRSGPGATPDWRLVAHNVGADFPIDQWNAGPDWNLEPGDESA